MEEFTCGYLTESKQTQRNNNSIQRERGRVGAEDMRAREQRTVADLINMARK